MNCITKKQRKDNEMGFFDALVGIGKELASAAGKGIANMQAKKHEFESYSDDRLVRIFRTRSGMEKGIAFTVVKGRYGEDTAKMMVLNG